MRGELTAEEGVLKGLVFLFEEGEEWILGRDPDECQIVLEDSEVSRKHLLCRKTEEGYLVENLSETNPVQVNETPLEAPLLLQEGDKILIGGTLFHFHVREPSLSLEMPPEEKKDKVHETIFEEEEAEVHLDLSQAGRFVLKVIAGPNTGAEFALDLNRQYLIGTEASSCDIVFHDLSVSKEHALLTITETGEMRIQDLKSRNGVLINKERIAAETPLPVNTVVTLGTSVFFIFDREAPSETIVAPLIEPQVAGEEKEEEKPEAEELPPEEVKPQQPPLGVGVLLLALILGGMTILLGIGMVSLFQTKEVKVVPPHDYVAEIKKSLKPFPGVKFTYNKASGKLFLVGDVLTSVEKNDLIFNLKGLNFISGIEDNVVVDESVWQEMNALLSKHSAFKGVSMHSPEPGKFVLSGYLQTNEQASALIDYMNLNFNYLDRLVFHVVVEEQLLEEVSGLLLQNGFNGVNASLVKGEVILTGYINNLEEDTFEKVEQQIKQIFGVRGIKNYVVSLSPEEAVVDLNEKFPGRYQVTGYSKHGEVNLNVVVNGSILMRGETIDGMTIVSIQPHTIFLEKDGLKYKIEYNK